jgi:hypothetical protein
LGKGDEDVATPFQTEAGQDASNSVSIPIPSRFPSSARCGRAPYGEEPRGSRAAALVARVGIGIGIESNVARRFDPDPDPEREGTSKVRGRRRRKPISGKRFDLTNRGSQCARHGW